MNKCHRLIRPLVLFFILAVVVLGATIAWIFWGTLPAYQGHHQLKGLSAEVRIYRDEHGVPHIFATSMNDAVRALGYVHASERFFQMEMQRRAGQGRLSEVVGPSMLGVDKFIRTLGLYHLAESSYDSLSPEAQNFFDAYTEGVNDWLRLNRDLSLPPEFTLLGIQPEPWRPADSLVWGKLMALQLSHNYKLEALRGVLDGKLSPLQKQGLFPPYGDAPVTMQKADKASDLTKPRIGDVFGSEPDLLGQVLGLDHAASNEWVISGNLTETGKPILANDPHLSLGIPILWYLADLETPDLMIKGATVPGLPVVLLGQNNNIAWGMTTTGSDVQDLFVETVDPNDSSKYFSPSGSEPFEVHEETIHVKGGQDVVLPVRATRHGPVLSDIDDDLAAFAGKGKVVALAFTGLGAHDTSSEAIMRINQASHWEEFLSILRRLYQAPPQNFVYADRAGNIGFVNPGLVPVRRKGDGTVPADGASGEYDWIDSVAFDQLPQMYNPTSGYIFNANNALVEDGHQPFLGIDWEEPWRAERIQQLLGSDLKQTLRMSMLMQADHVSLAARKLLPHLLEAQPLAGSDRSLLVEKIKNLMQGWDGTMDKDRPEPLIFEAWLYELHKLLFVDQIGQDLVEKGPYAAESIDYLLSNEGSGWCYASGCTQYISTALDKAIELLVARDGPDINAWRWGHEHQVFLKHKVFTHIPVLRNYADISIPSSGDFYTLDRGGSFEFDPEHPFARAHGGGYRAVYDLEDPAHSRFMITTGQSGHIFSSHYKDLVERWSNVQYITIAGNEAELRARRLPELVFSP